MYCILMYFIPTVRKIETMLTDSNLGSNLNILIGIICLITSNNCLRKCCNFPLLFQNQAQNDFRDIPSGSPMTHHYVRQGLPVSRIQEMLPFTPPQRRTVREQRDTPGSTKRKHAKRRSQCSRYVNFRCLVCLMLNILKQIIRSLENELNGSLLFIYVKPRTAKRFKCKLSFFYQRNISRQSNSFRRKILATKLFKSN